MQLEGNIEITKLRERFDECFNNEKDYNKLWSYLVKKGGYIFRARLENRDGLNLEEQIVARTLEDGGRDDGGNLEEFMAKWMVESYQRENSPCWQIAVIREKYKREITSVAFKIHHAFVDGYSCLHILDKLTGSNSPYLVKDREYNGFFKEIREFFEAPVKLMAGGPVQGTVDTAIFKVSLPDGRCLDWMYSFTSLSLKDMKIIRRRGNGGVHMTSVIWAVIGGALRRFLRENEGMDDDTLPELISVGATLPVPRHPAMVEVKGKDKLCNHWGSTVLKVPIREQDPEMRLKLIEDQLSAFLANGLDKAMDKVMPGLVWTAPAYFLSKTMGSRDFAGCSGYLSTMIGAEKYELLGCPVKNIHWCLAAPDTVPAVPLSCFTFSYGDKMELTLAANPNSIFKNKNTLDKISKQFVHEEL